MLQLLCSFTLFNMASSLGYWSILKINMKALEYCSIQKQGRGIQSTQYWIILFTIILASKLKATTTLQLFTIITNTSAH